MISRDKVEIMTQMERRIVLTSLLNVSLADGAYVNVSEIPDPAGKFCCSHPHFFNRHVKNVEKHMFYFSYAGLHAEVREHMLKPLNSQSLNSQSKGPISRDENSYEYRDREWTDFEKDFWDVILRREIVRMMRTLQRLEDSTVRENFDGPNDNHKRWSA